MRESYENALMSKFGGNILNVNAERLLLRAITRSLRATLHRIITNKSSKFAM